MEEIGPGIGNYVHLKQENYRKYGIIFRGDNIEPDDLTPDHDAQRQKFIQKSRTVRKFKQENLKKLSQLFTSFIYSD